MSTGIETVGLALAIFPVVIQLIESCNDLAKSRDVIFLAESLRNNEQLFLNSVEGLLRSILPAADVHVLLLKPGGEEWGDEKLNQLISQHLGTEASQILDKIRQIHSSLTKLKSKLPDVETQTSDISRLARATHVIKCFVKHPCHKSNLGFLKSRITEFRELTRDALELAPSRSGLPKTPSTLDLVQGDTAVGAVYYGLKSGWGCRCDHRKVLSNKTRLQLTLMLALGILRVSPTSFVNKNGQIMLAVDALKEPLPFITRPLLHIDDKFDGMGDESLPLRSWSLFD